MPQVHRLSPAMPQAHYTVMGVPPVKRTGLLHRLFLCTLATAALLLCIQLHSFRTSLHDRWNTQMLSVRAAMNLTQMDGTQPQPKELLAGADNGLLGDEPAQLRCALINNWGNRPLRSRLARQLQWNQLHASRAHNWRHLGTGLGSDLHTYAERGLCYGLENNVSVWAIGDWIWRDKQFCNETDSAHPMTCYFGDKMRPADNAPDITGRVAEGERCAQTFRRVGIDSYRSQAMEYVFTNVSVGLVRHAQQVLSSVAQRSGLDCGELRRNLITVHIRWTDKWKEMELQPLSRYIAAVEKLARAHNISRPVVFLTTEDRRAYDAFRNAIRSNASLRHWQLFTHEPAIISVATSTDGSKVSPPASAKRSAGRLGTASLVSLLVALEAHSYVLTTSSNWSRLLNELRQVVRDAGCGGGGCTRLIDLVGGPWLGRAGKRRLTLGNRGNIPDR